MAGEHLASLFQNYFNDKQTTQIVEAQEVQPEIYEPTFLHSEEIFDDILPVVEANEFGGLSYVGGQGNGKSFSAAEVATLAENEGYLVIYGKFVDVMLDLEAWKRKVKDAILKHGNSKLCLVLDDMSYSTGTISAKKAAIWKNFVGDIRHQFENVIENDSKPYIFLILLSHRYHSVPPIMRNSMSWIFASMNSEDRRDAQNLIPKNKEELEKLDKLYKFFLSVSSEGPQKAKEGKPIRLTLGRKEFDFLWGTKTNPGNGRLMIIYHKGEMKIYNPRKIENMIDLEDYRIKIEPMTAEEKKEAIRKKAEELFPPKVQVPEITAIVPVGDKQPW